MKYLWVILSLMLLFRLYDYQTSSKNYIDETKIRISGQVLSEPIRYDRSQLIRLNKFRFFLPLYPEISYGDKIIVEGTVIEDKLEDVVLVRHLSSKSALLNIRKSILYVYESSLPKDDAALIAGMTIGSKSLITRDLNERLKITGTAHVVVASGMNVALVAGFLINILIVFIKRQKAIVIAFTGIWIYAFIAGFDAPIIRAAIMASLAFSAQKVGRSSYAWRTLFLTIFIMLIIKPDWLSDLGFILSVAATSSLMLFENKIRKYFRFVPKLLREDLSTSFAAQILVAPLLFIYFNQVNLIAPFINGLVLWTVPIITVIGMFAGALGTAYLPAGRLMLHALYPLTSWFLFVVELFS